MVDYYDTFLMMIVAAMTARATASVHPAVALHQALAGGSLLATVILFGILFRNPPTDPTRTDTAASAAVGTGWALTILTYP